MLLGGKMKDIKNTCECLKKLMTLYKVLPYVSGIDTINYNYDEVEDGTLCLVSKDVVDNGEWDENFTWISDFEYNYELIPIEYCPICGKKIKYNKVKSLTKKY